MDLIWQNGVRFHDLRILTTFVWAVVGLILSGQIHLVDGACIGLAERTLPVKSDNLPAGWTIHTFCPATYIGD